MSLKSKMLLITTVAILTACHIKINPSKSRLLVIQEQKLNGEKSFFWFRDEKQITHEGLSFFQIADDKCKLSVDNANAYCNNPIQIYKIKKDTIFILVHSKITTIKPDKEFKIEGLGYSIELYDAGKKPNHEYQYFLDTVCPNK
jgi:hypothetical protein